MQLPKGTFGAGRDLLRLDAGLRDDRAEHRHLLGDARHVALAVLGLDLEPQFGQLSAHLGPAQDGQRLLLERETLAILHRPEMGAKLSELGFEIQARDGKGHMGRVVKEVTMFREIIAQAGIKPQ